METAMNKEERSAPPGAEGDPAYASATVLSAAANFIMDRPEPFTHTFVTYIRTREQGVLRLKLWHSNAVDSTWDEGQDSRAGIPGGEWQIESAWFAAGGRKDGQIAYEDRIPVTFGGSRGKRVLPGECFWSDEASVELSEGQDLVFGWTLRTVSGGKTIPFNVEDMLATAYDGPGTGEQPGALTLSEKLLVLPAYIGYRKQVRRKLAFFGDSITQGVRTARDGYEYWAAKIADGLGPETSVYNLGSGWARAYDASGGGPWLGKMSGCDEALLVLGVNDLDIGRRTAEELLGDLGELVARLKSGRPDLRIMLGTVPPFNMEDEREREWREVNRRLRENPPRGTDAVFDIAAVLSEPAPREHRIRSEYMSGEYDPHPNGLAGTAVAEAFLAWYRQP
ncbi:SGNH/GDSL hydrolase family protein [Paenibacillus spiritus]|nr:SGNH/GDSL hydrolase family protein [Paenibacillus spiritus]